MKKRVSILLVLVACLPLLGGSLPAVADSPGNITGGINFTVPEWGDGRFWLRFDVRQVSPDSDEAEGVVNYRLNCTFNGLKWIQARPICVSFGDDNGARAALVVVQIEKYRGFSLVDYDHVGGYAKFWVRDGGTPGTEGDQFNMQSWCDYPKEFWPGEDPGYPNCAWEIPDCDWASYDPDPAPGPHDIDGGNLVIRP